MLASEVATVIGQTVFFFFSWIEVIVSCSFFWRMMTEIGNLVNCATSFSYCTWWLLVIFLYGYYLITYLVSFSSWNSILALLSVLTFGLLIRVCRQKLIPKCRYDKQLMCWYILRTRNNLQCHWHNVNHSFEAVPKKKKSSSIWFF